MVLSSIAEKLLLWKQKAMAVEYQKRRLFYKPRKGVKGIRRAEWKKKKRRTKEGRRVEGKEGGKKERSIAPISSITLRKVLFSNFKLDQGSSTQFQIVVYCLTHSLQCSPWSPEWSYNRWNQSASAPNNSHHPSSPVHPGNLTKWANPVSSRSLWQEGTAIMNNF